MAIMDRQASRENTEANMSAEEKEKSSVTTLSTNAPFEETRMKKTKRSDGKQFFRARVSAYTHTQGPVTKNNASFDVRDGLQQHPIVDL